MKKTFTIVFLSGIISSLYATEIEGFSLESDGSSVVITVLAIIFVGMFIYLFATDRKISKLEKELKEK